MCEQASLKDYRRIPRVRCRDHNFSPDRPAQCAGVAAVEKSWTNDEGDTIGVQYRCEFGHGFTLFMDRESGQLQGVDGEPLDDRIVEDDREIGDRWVCEQHEHPDGRDKYLIWPWSTEVCPRCDEGTRYDCQLCGEQLCRTDVVNEKGDGYAHKECVIDEHTVPASEVEA